MAEVGDPLLNPVLKHCERIPIQVGYQVVLIIDDSRVQDYFFYLCSENECSVVFGRLVLTTCRSILSCTLTLSGRPSSRFCSLSGSRRGGLGSGSWGWRRCR